MTLDVATDVGLADPLEANVALPLLDPFEVAVPHVILGTKPFAVGAPLAAGLVLPQGLNTAEVRFEAFGTRTL